MGHPGDLLHRSRPRLRRQSGWTKREAPGGYTGTYRAVVLLSTGYGLAVGDNAALHETFDYGATWRDAHPDAVFAGRFTAVAIAAGKAVVVGEGGAIQVKNLPNGTWAARTAAGGASGAFRAVALDPNADAVALGDAGLAQRTSRLTGATLSYTVPAGSDMLATNKIYFWRVRYSDLLGRWSPWSDGTVFATSATFNYVRQPENIVPASGDDAVSVVPTFQAGAFSVVGSPDTHAKSRWQVARDQAFASIAHDSGEVSDLTSYTLPSGSPLEDQKTYFWRVAFKGAANGLSSFSAPTSFKTSARPNRPTITAPAADATNVAIAPTITTSAFSMPGGGVHDASRYQVSATASFASLVYDSGWTATDKTSHTLPAGKLAFDTQYYVRAQHRESGGQVSAFSAVIAFKTVKAPNIQELFSATLYNGSGASRTITNGLDLAGSGGLVWLKIRSSNASHALFDTGRGPNKALQTDTTAAEYAPDGLSAFSSTGFTIGSDGAVNRGGETYVSWAFRKAASFFDIVTYTGDGVPNRRIAHKLGVEPGMIIVKNRQASDGNGWYVYHRSFGFQRFWYMNQYNAGGAGFVHWGDAAPTAADFGTGPNAGGTNRAGGEFVAYVFAHNPDLIDCGNYVGNGASVGPAVQCGSGWMPQFLLVKAANKEGHWLLFDSKRTNGSGGLYPIYANIGGNESGGSYSGLTANGFRFNTSSWDLNEANQTYLYMAIRSPT